MLQRVRRYAAMRLANRGGDRHPCHPPGREPTRVTTVATFDIEYVQYLDPEGKLVREDLPEFAQDPARVAEHSKQRTSPPEFDATASTTACR